MEIDENDRQKVKNKNSALSHGNALFIYSISITMGSIMGLLFVFCHR